MKQKTQEQRGKSNVNDNGISTIRTDKQSREANSNEKVDIQRGPNILCTT